MASYTLPSLTLLYKSSQTANFLRRLKYFWIIRRKESMRQVNFPSFWLFSDSAIQPSKKKEDLKKIFCFKNSSTFIKLGSFWSPTFNQIKNKIRKLTFFYNLFAKSTKLFKMFFFNQTCTSNTQLSTDNLCESYVWLNQSKACTTKWLTK